MGNLNTYYWFSKTSWYRLLSIKDKIFLKHNVEITGTIYALDDKKVYTILEIITFH